MKVKAAVYDSAVAVELMQLARACTMDMESAAKIFPRADTSLMISMSLHHAATIATNAAEGAPLDRAWREVELEDEPQMK